MARITFQDIAHSYIPRPRGDADFALKRVHSVWEDGGAYALLGPSGCGKTTLLNIVSGLIRPTRGRVLFGERDVTDLPPEKRNIAQVFQFPVLYDTMSVFDNLAFPLRNRKVPEDQVEKRVMEVAGILDLSDSLRKKAAGLTADAKQKISLGRGLVRSDVAAILFDEPLTVIDPQLKWHLRRKLKEIHEQLKLTLIYVTHDQVEALTVAEQVMVMYAGEIVQTGTPQDLFENPMHRFVGYFIGSPGMNFLPCAIDGDRALVGGFAIPLPASVADTGRRASGELEIGIRPMYLEVNARPADGSVSARIKSVEDQGNYRIVTLTLGPHLLRARVEEGVPLPDGEAWVRFPPEKIRLFADQRWIKPSQAP